MSALTAEYISLTGPDDGIMKLIKVQGSGDYPVQGDEVVAHYIGTLEDGSKFDSSVDRGQVRKKSLRSEKC